MRMDPKSVALVAQRISRCDFRVTISRYMSINVTPWIITVGESDWQRHLVVREIEDDASNASLALLAPEQSSKFGMDINTSDVERYVTLVDLVTGSYNGVKERLQPAHAVPA